MDLTKEWQKRKEFKDILFELAKSQELLQDSKYCLALYQRLELFYDAESNGKRFRHFYSDIFSALLDIQQNPKLGDINILGQNLDVIRREYNPINKSPDGKRMVDISDAINKLYDHVSLEIARITYSDAGDRRISGESAIRDLQSQINAVHGELPRTEKKLCETEEKLNNLQKEYVAILGIFAAVVLAFTGGIAFSTSVLNNIAQASIYRTICIALIIGLVILNVLFGLFYYINSLINRDRKILPLVIANVTIVILLAATVVGWKLGFVENRNNNINKRNNMPPEEVVCTNEES